MILNTTLTTLDGSPVSSNDVLVKYTYYGDTNLDGQVNSTDYARIDNGYLSHLTGWANGDFNYDGVTNGSDYTLIDNSSNTQGAQLAAEYAVSTTQLASSAGIGEMARAVPEPSSLLMMGLGASGLFGRRRSRSRC